MCGSSRRVKARFVLYVCVFKWKKEFDRVVALHSLSQLNERKEEIFGVVVSRQRCVCVCA